METFTEVCKSPFGNLKIVTTKNAVKSVDFTKEIPLSGQDSPLILKKTLKELDDYFRGDLKSFSVRVDADGTDFQKKVWGAMATIPYGKTASYKDIAVKIGKPKGVRAVGGACGRNPVGIIYPCHRIIGSDGSLTGFGGGLELKAALLEHEQKHTSRK